MSDEERSEAARAMGRARTPAKIAAAKENAAKARAAREADPAAHSDKVSEGMRDWHRRRKEARQADDPTL